MDGHFPCCLTPIGGTVLLAGGSHSDTVHRSEEKFQLTPLVQVSRRHTSQVSDQVCMFDTPQQRKFTCVTSIFAVTELRSLLWLVTCHSPDMAATDQAKLKGWINSFADPHTDREKEQKRLQVCYTSKKVHRAELKLFYHTRRLRCCSQNCPVSGRGLRSIKAGRARCCSGPTLLPPSLCWRKSRPVWGRRLKTGKRVQKLSPSKRSLSVVSIRWKMRVVLHVSKLLVILLVAW